MQRERGVEILDAAILVAILGWCAKALLSLRRNARVDSPALAKPVARMTNEILIETVSDPLGRV